MSNKNNHNNQKTKNLKPLKFLFIEWEALNGDLAWQIKKEGHQVKIYIDKKDEQDVYNGFIEKTNDWKKEIDWADVVVFDDVGFGKYADELRKKGKLVVGGSTYADKLEEDRKFGQQEMKKYGMNILPFHYFSNFDDGIKFIKENPGRYVFKPSNTDPTIQKDLLFIGEDEEGKDLIEIIEQNKKNWSKKIPNFQLQKFASGVEIAVGAFFNGHDFVYPINVNFEHKRLFPGEIGPFTGEMGTLMYWSKPNYIFHATLEKMKEPLAQAKYVGYIDINCIANGYGIYPLEFTSRFGYPTISVQTEGITIPKGELLYKLAKGEDFEIKTKNGFQIGVVICTPAFLSFEDNETYKDLAIRFKKNNLEGIHLGDVKIENGIWRMAGNSGYTLVVTGSGSTVAEARHVVYNRIKNIKIQNMFYRVDIGLRWLQDSDKLQTWNYLF